MKKFKLQSEYSPKGDQPAAIQKLVQGIKKGYKGQVLLGATGTGKTFTMANVIDKLQKPSLIICHNKTLAAQLASEFQSFFPENTVCYFVSYYDYYQPEAYVAKTDTYIEKETSINDEIAKHRHTATSSLLNEQNVIIVASVSAIYGLGDKDSYESLSFSLKTGEEYIREVLLKQLVELQYKRAMGEFKQGTFNVLGDTIEIFPPSGDNIIRLDFFGDELDKIEECDGFTGETLKDMPEVTFFPASHNVTTKEKINQAIPKILEDLDQRYRFFLDAGMIAFAERIKSRTEYDIEMLRETGYCSGIENYISYLNGADAGSPPPTLMDYFPKDFLLFIDESHITVPQIRGMYNGNLARKKNLVDFGFRLPSAYDNRPLKYKEFEQYLDPAMFVSATPQEYEFQYSDNHVVEQIIRPTGLVDPEIELKDSADQVTDVLEEVKLRTEKNERVLITTTTKKLAEKLSDFLIDNNISAKYLHSEIDTFERVEILKLLRQGGRNEGIDVIVGINLLREGLDLPEVSLVAVMDADKQGFLRSRDALIQIVGRAARNLNGKVIMYTYKKSNGDLNITPAMEKCIEETDRRREKQVSYNKKHNITPEAIKKNVEYISEHKKEEPVTQQDVDKMPQEERKRLLKDLEGQMELASMNLEFEKAAGLRDQIETINLLIKSEA